MSTEYMILATLVALLGAGGTYLLLPHHHGASRTKSVHVGGAILAGLALLIFLTFFSPPGPFLAGLFFYLFSIGALVGALLTVCSRNPIYSALWFASVVLCTAGLFLLAGAQFLAAGTIIVYAGAIIVTFLFVIMLAQMEGKAVYDRAARAPGSATLTSFLLFWCLLYAIGTLTPEPAPGTVPPGQRTAASSLVPAWNMSAAYHLHDTHSARAVLARSLRATSDLHDSGGREKPNVAGLGEALYSDHLVTVELAGSLLFVALIAAVVITNPRRPSRPGDTTAGNGQHRAADTMRS
jgi:NADH-quinone oxidoreductase subunit J